MAFKCKHCSARIPSIGAYGKHMARKHKAALKAQLAKGRRKRGKASGKHRSHSGGSSTPKAIRKASLARLIALLAMIQALIKQKRKRKHKGKKRR